MKPGSTHLPRTSMMRTSPDRPPAIPLPCRATTPSFRITSASASTPRPGSMTRPPRRQRSIRPGPLDRRSRGGSQRVSELRGMRRPAGLETGCERRRRRGLGAIADRAEAAVDLGARPVVLQVPQAICGADRIGACLDADGPDVLDKGFAGALGLDGGEPVRTDRDHRLVVAEEKLAAAADALDLRVTLARAP